MNKVYKCCVLTWRFENNELTSFRRVNDPLMIRAPTCKKNGS